MCTAGHSGSAKPAGNESARYDWPPSVESTAETFTPFTAPVSAMKTPASEKLTADWTPKELNPPGRRMGGSKTNRIRALDDTIRESKLVNMV